MVCGAGLGVPGHEEGVGWRGGEGEAGRVGVRVEGNRWSG